MNEWIIRAAFALLGGFIGPLLFVLFLFIMADRSLKTLSPEKPKYKPNNDNPFIQDQDEPSN